MVKQVYRLRPIEEADLEMILEWRNSERVRRMMFTDRLITPEEHRAWFARTEAGQQPYFRVFELNERPAGYLAFTGVDRHSQRCAWGFYLGEASLPPGTGTLLGFAGLEYGFDELGFRKICGEILAYNEPSIRLHLRLGFSQEGCFRAHVLKDGDYRDMLAFALFKEAWPAHKARLEALLFGEKG